MCFVCRDWLRDIDLRMIGIVIQYKIGENPIIGRSAVSFHTGKTRVLGHCPRRWSPMRAAGELAHTAASEACEVPRDMQNNQARATEPDGPWECDVPLDNYQYMISNYIPRYIRVSGARRKRDRHSGRLGREARQAALAATASGSDRRGGASARRPAGQSCRPRWEAARIQRD